MEDLRNYRKSYEKSELGDSGLPDLPMQLFEQWFEEADAMEREDKGEVNAMTIATIGRDGYPKSRVVLLKQFDQNGLVFFTNYKSEKGKAIAGNPHVCISFFWHWMERQVIIKGKIEKTSLQVSEEYFHQRPRGSQLGAAASQQSEVIASREALDNALNELEQKYQGKDVPRPEDWGGYVVVPVEVEFWQGRRNRMHDRIRYIFENREWKRDRLSP